jgi:hypothetical protein
VIYMVDIDDTICSTTDKDYHNSVPYMDRIKRLNNLYDDGHEIHYWTARGTSSGIDWLEHTTKQLDSWGCKYHSIKVGKPSYDVWIDDKAINSEDFFRTRTPLEQVWEYWDRHHGDKI